MSSTKRKQGKPRKSLFAAGSEEDLSDRNISSSLLLQDLENKDHDPASMKTRGPKTRNQARSLNQVPETRRSQRVPKKKVPFSNEIPIPKKRLKRRVEEQKPSITREKVSPVSYSSTVKKAQLSKRENTQVTIPRKKVEQRKREELIKNEESTELLSDSDSESSDIKIETDSEFKSVCLTLKNTLENLQTVQDPTINVEIPYFVIKKKKKKKKKMKKKSKAGKKNISGKNLVEPKEEKTETEVDLEEAAKENVLDIDQLRKLSADSLVQKYADHQTVTVPKDKDNTIHQSVYTCRMLPSHCFEKFMGIDEDTKHQITRHLLRHVGELLTMANEGMASQGGTELVTQDDEDEAAAFITTAAKKTTYHVASNPKPFTVSHPQNVNLKRSRYTVIRSSEGKEGTNEVVLLPRGRGFYSYRPLEEDPQPEGVTEQSFHSVIDNLLGQASIAKVDEEVNSTVAGTSQQILLNSTEVPQLNLQSGNTQTVIFSETKEGVDNTLQTQSGLQTSVIILDEKDIQMDVEVSTGARKRKSPFNSIPDGVGSIMKMNHVLSGSDVAQNLLAADQTSENQEVPYPDHNYSYSDGINTSSVHTDSDGAPTVAPLSIEESDSDKLDINPIINSMNEQVSRLIPDIEHPEGSTSGTNSLESSQVQEGASVAEGSPDPAAAAIASVMTPEEEEMLRLKAVDLLDSLLKNQKRRGPFRCQICQKILTAASTLRAHYRSHAGIKPFQCLLCNATFTRQHSLNYHMMIHNQEARFSCSFCARQFRHANHFREHLRRHTGEEPYGCTDCPARFKTRNTYKRHMRSKHSKLVTHKNSIKLITEENVS